MSRPPLRVWLVGVAFSGLLIALGVGLVVGLIACFVCGVILAIYDERTREPDG